MATKLTKREKALIKAIKELIHGYTHGDCYRTTNPYCRQYVKDAMTLLAEIDGVKCYLDVDLTIEK